MTSSKLKCDNKLGHYLVIRSSLTPFEVTPGPFGMAELLLRKTSSAIEECPVKTDIFELDELMIP